MQASAHIDYPSFWGLHWFLLYQ